MALLVLLLVPALPATRADVVLQFRSASVARGAGPLAPFAASSVVTGAGTCLSYSNATVPFGPGSSRGNVSVTVPRGCLGGTRLTFLPSLRFTNGLPVLAGHLLRANLTLVGLNGSNPMVRRAQLYLQHVGGTNQVITTTQILVRNGAIVTAQTSSGTIAAANVYGIGFRLQLNHFATVSRATFSLVLVTYLDDGGVVRALDQQRVTMLVVY